MTKTAQAAANLVADAVTAQTSGDPFILDGILSAATPRVLRAAAELSALQIGSDPAGSDDLRIVRDRICDALEA